MTKLARIALAALAALPLPSCAANTLGAGGSEVVVHDLTVLRQELGEARDAASEPAAASALADAYESIDKFLAELKPINRATKTPENRAALRVAFEAAIASIEAVERPEAELVLVRAEMRRLLVFM